MFYILIFILKENIKKQRKSHKEKVAILQSTGTVGMRSCCSGIQSEPYLSEAEKQWLHSFLKVTIPVGHCGVHTHLSKMDYVHLVTKVCFHISRPDLDTYCAVLLFVLINTQSAHLSKMDHANLTMKVCLQSVLCRMVISVVWCRLRRGWVRGVGAPHRRLESFRADLKASGELAWTMLVFSLFQAIMVHVFSL